MRLLVLVFFFPFFYAFCHLSFCSSAYIHSFVPLSIAPYQFIEIYSMTFYIYLCQDKRLHIASSFLFVDLFVHMCLRLNIIRLFDMFSSVREYTCTYTYTHAHTHTSTLVRIFTIYTRKRTHASTLLVP